MYVVVLHRITSIRGINSVRTLLECICRIYIGLGDCESQNVHAWRIVEQNAEKEEMHRKICRSTVVGLIGFGHSGSSYQVAIYYSFLAAAQLSPIEPAIN